MERKLNGKNLVFNQSMAMGAVCNCFSGGMGWNLSALAGRHSWQAWLAGGY